MIREIQPDEIDSRIGGLTELLVDAVGSGASVSFMASTTRAELERFWRGVAADARAGTVRLLGAFDDDRLVGMVTLRLATPPNQPHRAEVAKLLVHRDARRRGVGRALMLALEELARAARKSLLTLDTVTGDAGERLYAALGWSRVGVIPNYALFPDGRPCDTTVFYKQL